MGDDDVCLRDYSKSCPEGWADAGDGATCLAPDGYVGGCSAVVNYANLTPEEKAAQARECGTIFPCIGGCFRDFAAPCPEGWGVDAGFECTAPASYTGLCVRRMRFDDMSHGEKASWGNACAVTWPCRETLGVRPDFNRDCAQDFSAACPHRWSHDGHYCRAPSNYGGECGFFIEASHFSNDQKQALAEACNAPWPCTVR